MQSPRIRRHREGQRLVGRASCRLYCVTRGRAQFSVFLRNTCGRHDAKWVVLPELRLQTVQVRRGLVVGLRRNQLCTPDSWCQGIRAWAGWMLRPGILAPLGCHKRLQTSLSSWKCPFLPRPPLWAQGWPGHFLHDLLPPTEPVGLLVPDS